jgi:hypothetical protein
MRAHRLDRLPDAFPERERNRAHLSAAQLQGTLRHVLTENDSIIRVPHRGLWTRATCGGILVT